MDLLNYEYLLQTLSSNIGTIILICILFLLYNYYTATHSYFRDRGIPFIKPKIILGNIAQRVFMKISFHDFNIQIYNHFDGLPYGGYFEGRRPLLVLRCPDLIKTIMIRDFDYFTDRNNLNSNAPPSIKKMLINLKGEEWKKVRTILTPAFSSGKLHAMEIFLQECGEQMCTFLKNRPEGEVDVEMKEFIGRYTLEVIGSCAFGLDCASLKDPNAEFVKIAGKFANMSVGKRIIFFLCLMFCPSAMRFIPTGFFNNEALAHLESVVLKTKMMRETNTDNRRNDFMQLMLDMAQKELNNNEEIVMSDDVIKAQAILFLFAGFETTSTLLSFCCSLLCENRDIQDKLREEIMAALDKNGGKCDYEMINNIPLLEKVLLETLRMYPPVSRVDRVCTKQCKIPDTNLSFDVGDVVVIPIAGVMQDPQHYPNPDVFDPERFALEEKSRRPPQLYLPFGLGRRNCIGLRFAMMSAKFGLFYLIRDYQMSPCSKTQTPIRFDKRAVLLKSEKGNWVKLEPL